MEEKKIFWEFAPTGGGDDDGFSDALIETFSGDVDKYLAREAIQNSLDARLDEKKPISLEFERLVIKKGLLPDYNVLREIFVKCIDYWPDDKKVQKFYKRAIEIIDKESIVVLRIRDFNTVGLRGSDTDKKGEWYCLVKAQGASSKQEKKLGSFGIGKGAPFAASAFRTVFYSTFNDINENVFQGKARLVSHINGEPRRGTGSYGGLNQSSIRDEKMIPPFFLRKERGTDINVIGYLGKEDEWQDNLIISILENFWAAILCNDLEVKVGSKSITKDTLEQDLLKYCGRENPDSAYNYYTAYTKPNKKITEKIDFLGTCSLYILLQEKASKNIAMMRKSRMLVKNQRFMSPKAFIGVFICEDEKGNELLRDMEPPSHRDWEPKRIDDGEKIIKSIKDWIRKTLKELTQAEIQDTSGIPGLEKYFQLPEDDEYEGDIENVITGSYSGTTTDQETGKESSIIVKDKDEHVGFRHSEPVIYKNTEGGRGGSVRQRNGKNKKQYNHGGGGEGTGKTKYFKDVSCKSRNFLINKLKDELEYKIVLSPREDFKGNIKLSANGMDGDYPIEILEVNNISTSENLKCENSTIKDIELIKDATVELKLRIKSSQKYKLILG